LGGTYNDNATSIFILLSILLLLIAADNVEPKKAKHEIITIIAGFIMGAGVGLKPTNTIYALSSAVALMFLFKARQNRIRYFLSYSIAGIVGWFAAAGFWCWELWTRYENPLFPFLNNIFQSEYIRPVAFTDKHLLPTHLWEYFIWPIIFSSNSGRVFEAAEKFVDLRFAIIYILFLVWGICVFRKSKTGNQHFNSQAIKFLGVFFALSFILWMITSSIYRYLITLELLVPIIFLVLLERIVQSNRSRILIGISVLIALYVIFRPSPLGRINWSAPYISIQSSRSLKIIDNAVVIMLGCAPMSYVIPFFPPTTRFIRPEGNLCLQNQNLFYQEIIRIIEKQKKSGKIYVLFDKKDWDYNLKKSLNRLGLDSRQLDCYKLIINKHDYLTLCQVW
jgi:hypothetical protein